jgi:hypothetical protein
MQYLKRSIFMRVLAAAVFSLWLTAATLAETAPEAAGPPTWAVWTPKELRFVYLGFTSHYSCDGLRDKMRAILLQLGARPDFDIRAVPCSGDFGRPSEFPGVTVKMNVLAPWDSTRANAAVTPVPAHWKLVELSTDRDPLREAGDCELVEQVKSRVLPLFTTRNIEYRSTCIPNQLSVGGTQLKAEVLIADDQGAQPPGTKIPAPPAPPAAR